MRTLRLANVIIPTLVILLFSANAATAQNDRRPDRDKPTEINIRYDDHKNVTEPLMKAMKGLEEYWETVYEPAMEKQRSSGGTAMFEIPHSVRMELVEVMNRVQGVAQGVLRQSVSYSKFKRDDSQCRAWVDVMQYYVSGLGALAQEMSRTDLSSGAFANMAMGQLTAAMWGLTAVNPAVLPCFLEKGKYIQPITPFVRDKYEEIHGTKPPGFR